MSDEDRDGWWDVPAAATWVCPECGETSPVEEWVACEPGCEDCGSHDGRQCPRCEEQFDHVWGSPQIADAIEKSAREAT